jgi:hypothetical protein
MYCNSTLVVDTTALTTHSFCCSERAPLSAAAVQWRGGSMAAGVAAAWRRRPAWRQRRPAWRRRRRQLGSNLVAAQRQRQQQCGGKRSGSLAAARRRRRQLGGSGQHNGSLAAAAAMAEALPPLPLCCRCVPSWW